MPNAFQKLYPLVKSVLILLLIFLTIGGLYFARTFLIPLAFAAIFAMLLTPVSQYLEAKGFNRPAATFCCILLLLLVVFALIALLSTQVSAFVQDFQSLESQIKSQVSEIRQYFRENFGVSPQKAVQGNSGGPGIQSAALSFLGSFTSILAHSLLTLVYLFMLMNYRSHFSKFILKVVPDNQKDKAKDIVSNSGNVAQQYLFGRGILIAILAVLYSIGLILVGVNHAILFSVLAAVVSIVPYFGNIIGMVFPLLMVVVQGGGWMMLLGIVIVFSVSQFIESYFLEPYIVGSEVNIHPFFTIVSIIAGELIWGVSGMILAIPMVAILKILMENIPPLKPYAFLIGSSHQQKNSKPFKDKIKGWFNS